MTPLDEIHEIAERMVRELGDGRYGPVQAGILLTFHRIERLSAPAGAQRPASPRTAGDVVRGWSRLPAAPSVPSQDAPLVALGIGAAFEDAARLLAGETGAVVPVPGAAAHQAAGDVLATGPDGHAVRIDPACLHLKLDDTP